jgi:uncharacterized protein YbaR (Trm112 family)
MPQKKSPLSPGRISLGKALKKSEAMPPQKSQKRSRNGKMIKKELLEILACPQCKGPVTLNQEQNGIVCRACRLVFEIRDNIPIMLIDEAKPLEDAKP